MALLLKSPDHSGKIYGGEDVAFLLNNAAGVDDNPHVSTRINVTTLLRSFANDAANVYGLAYDDYFQRLGDSNVLFVRRKQKGGRHGGTKGAIYFGRFSSMEAGERAVVVRWRVSIDEAVRGELFRFLSKPKKRASSEISPDDEEADEPPLHRPPLVEVQPRPQQHNNKNEEIVLHYVLGGGQGQLSFLPTTDSSWFENCGRISCLLLPAATMKTRFELSRCKHTARTNIGLPPAAAA